VSFNFEDLFDAPLLAATLGPRDHHGYYGRREVDGQIVAIVPLTFGRARIVMIDRVSDCPYDGW
jgi:hypothetical protein